MIRIKMVREIFENDLNDFDFIEQINFKDADLLAEAMYKAYKDTPDYENDSVEDFRNELKRMKANLYGKLIPEACLYVKAKEEIIAAIFVCDFRGEATMTYCFTNPEYRDRGVGQGLINYAENELKKLGYKHFYLYLTLANKLAYNLFESLGFTETEIN